MAFKNKEPLVTVACICERVLREEDGVLSAIRITDKFILRGPEAEPSEVGLVQTTALVMLRAGDLEGPSEVALQVHSPTGKKSKTPHRFPILLQGKTRGPNHGANLIVDLLVPAGELGHYKLDILWNGSLLREIPFEITRAPVQASPALPE